jgi:hypothetical protein
MAGYIWWGEGGVRVRVRFALVFIPFFHFLLVSLIVSLSCRPNKVAQAGI